MLKNTVFDLVLSSLQSLAQKGTLPEIVPELIVIEHPKDPRFGDFSTNIAMRMAKGFGKPLDLAQLIVEGIPQSPLFDKVEVLAPGFINFYVSEKVLKDGLKEILVKEKGFGTLEIGRGKRVQVEYLSCNPTGPMHVGNARGLIGYPIANVLKKAGYEVEKEYYVNDIGGQAEKFVDTLVYWFKKDQGEDLEFPEKGYPGEYHHALSQKVVETVGKESLLSMPEAEMREVFRKVGFDLSMAQIKETIGRLKVDFDKYVSQSDIHKDYAEKIFEELENRGHVAETEGATWFVSQDFKEQEDSKESVLKKSDEAGTYTYFMDDIAYHWDKFVNRKFDLVIDIWGSNHFGHVARMKAAMKALGLDPEALQIPLYQFVRLKQGEAVVKMAKRAGTYITADQVLQEVPSDVFKFFLLMRAPESHLDFDFELAKDTSDKNPLYYVQYALARMHGILRQSDLDLEGTDLSLLKEPEEIEVIKQMISFPETIEEVSQTFEVQKLPYFAIELARKLHGFYDKHRVLSDDKELTRARLSLVKAATIVISETLTVIGVDAPERM